MASFAVKLASWIAGAVFATAAVADAPVRVVSINLCTDQLAMMLAAPGQLVAVSDLARDPRVSPVAQEAQGVDIHYGRAEEVYLLRPDLVVGGQFTGRTTVDMLRRLGIPVIVFPPANSLDEVREALMKMGEALGREEAATQAVADFDARLAALPPAAEPRPRAALFEPNGYTAGEKTLSGQILKAAGFVNISAELGYDYAGNLPLELLVMAQPDIVISSQPFPGASRSEDVVTHPAVRRLKQQSTLAHLSDRSWLCGTPHALDAVEQLVAARETLERRAQQ